MAAPPDDLKQVLIEVLVPLLETEGGELYLVEASKKEVKLHLAGAFAGSPAADTICRRIVEPVVRKVHPKAKLTVSSGWRIPNGAEKLTS